MEHPPRRIDTEQHPFKACQVDGRYLPVRWIGFVPKVVQRHCPCLCLLDRVADLRDCPAYLKVAFMPGGLHRDALDDALDLSKHRLRWPDHVFEPVEVLL